MTDAALILGYEAMRGLRGADVEIETPLERTPGVKLADEVFVIAILRAGLGLVDGFLRLVPEARVGHLGMYRDEEALRPVGYYENIPRASRTPRCSSWTRCSPPAAAACRPSPA